MAAPSPDDRPAPPSSPASPSQTLPRARIIRRRAVFDATREKGRRFASRWMSLNVLPRDPSAVDQGAVAFLTPKRLGNAVVRNRLRRRMREAYRRHLADAAESSYLVWIARPPAVELDSPGLLRCMTELKKRRV